MKTNTTKQIADKIESLKKKHNTMSKAKRATGVAATIAAFGVAGTLLVGGASDLITDACMNKIAGDISQTEGYSSYSQNRRHQLSAQVDLGEISYDEFLSEYGALGSPQDVLHYAKTSDDSSLNVTAENYEKSKDFAHTLTHKAAPTMLIAALSSGALCGSFDIAKTIYELKLENAKKKQEEMEMAE